MISTTYFYLNTFIERKGPAFAPFSLLQLKALRVCVYSETEVTSPNVTTNSKQFHTQPRLHFNSNSFSL